MKNKGQIGHPRSRRSGEPHDGLLKQITGLTESQAIALVHRFGSDRTAIRTAAARLATPQATLLPQPTD